MFKLLAFSVVTLLVVYQPFVAEADQKDDVKKAFHSRMAKINATLNEVQDSLNKALNTVKAKATEVQVNATAELDKVLQPLRKKLNESIAKSRAKGFNVTCQKFVDDFSQIPNTFNKNLTDCINKLISTAQDLVNGALNNAKTIVGNLNAIDGEIDNCQGSAFKQAGCYARLLAKIERDTNGAPSKMLADVARVTQLVMTLLPRLGACGVEELTRSGEQAATDVAQFGICAAV